jgi:hypothetical protein
MNGGGAASDPMRGLRRIALFTSIPARIERFDASGAEVGAAYLRRCVESWLAAGCRLVSINGPDEIAEIAPKFAGVEFHPVERTAAAAYGRPLVYLADVLSAAAAAPESLIGVINADLFLAAADALDAAVAAADGKALIYGQRLDVDDLDHPREQQRYFWGLDYFFCAPTLLDGLADEGFVFGETWWDYWLPVVLAKRGCRLRMVPEPLVVHLRHGEGPLGHHAQFYLDMFRAFARALSVRLPLPVEHAATGQINLSLSAFIRHFRPSATPAEQAYFAQYLSLVMKLYLEQHPAPIDALRQAWLGHLARAPDPVGREVIGSVLASVDQARQAPVRGPG